MDWTPDKLEFFVNGNRTWHLNRSPGSTNHDWPYAKPHFAVLNLAVGGNGVSYATPPDDAYPFTFSIDYFLISALPPPPLSPPPPRAPPTPETQAPPLTPPLPPLLPRATARVPNWQKWAWLDYPSDAACDSVDPHTCFGNGECGGDGVCLCDVGWRGAYCSQLDLLPANRSAFGLPMDGAMPTWGGTATFDEATQHWAFVTGCKLHNVSLSSPDYAEWQTHWAPQAAPSAQTFWGRLPPYNETALWAGGDPFGGSDLYNFSTAAGDPHNASQNPNLYGGSYLARMLSVGADAAGPYNLAAVERKGFRADTKRPFGMLDGPLYMLTAGRATDPTTGNLVGHLGFVIMRSASGSAAGPWEERVVYEFAANGHGSNASAWDCDVKDPSFVIHSNGTTVIAYRGVCCDCGSHLERVGMLVAPAWNGIFIRAGVPVFVVRDPPLHTHRPVAP